MTVVDCLIIIVVIVKILRATDMESFFVAIGVGIIVVFGLKRQNDRHKRELERDEEYKQ